MENTKILGNLISGILLLVFLSGCNDSIKDKLIRKINTDCGDNTDSSCKIALTDVTKFKWDKMYLLPNWTTQDSITQLIGFKYDGDDVPDQYWRMLFTNGKQVVREEDFESGNYSRPTIDFDDVDDSIFKVNPYCLSVSKAKFSVKKEKIEHACKDCFNYSFEFPIKQKLFRNRNSEFRNN